MGDQSAQLRVVAIDGPAGSGKSTVARKVAARLGVEYLDTGAMYRAVAFAALRRGIDPADEAPVAEMVSQLELAVTDGTVIVDGVDASQAIRGPEVSGAVRFVAANPAVRRELQARQRSWTAARGGGVLEGRDIGTVVFPDALVKVYLTASPRVRAERRAAEWDGIDVDQVAAEIAERDAADRGRATDPLKEADGSTEVDTSEMSIDEVVETVVHLVEQAVSR